MSNRENNSVPQPRYSSEHKEQAMRQHQPLFTLDINCKHLTGMRATTTGVLSASEGEEMILRIRRMMAQFPEPKESRNGS